MATAKCSRECFQRLVAYRPKQITSQQSRSLVSSTGQRHQQPAPLYLDFLAPSWPRPTPHVERSIRMKHLSSMSQQSRPFSSTHVNQAVAITNPRKDDDGKEMKIDITARAANRLQAIAEKDSNPDLALRVSVESGGCHGFQYLMSLVNTSDIDTAEDTLFENEKVEGDQGDYKAKVVMDEPSLELLKGSSIDYTMELIGRQYKVTGIAGATSSCGCGTSFDIAPS